MKIIYLEIYLEARKISENEIVILAFNLEN